MSKTLLVLMVGMVVGACGGQRPTAMATCEKIVASGVGSNCRVGKPGGLGAAASEQAEFDLLSVPGKTGQVLSFGDEAGFDATTDAYGKAAVLAGPHRYGSKKARIFVQANSGLGAAEGAKLKAVVDSL